MTTLLSSGQRQDVPLLPCRFLKASTSPILSEKSSAIGKNLPHWQQDQATYFLTFHLADSIPQHLLATWRDERAIWLSLHPKPWTSKIEQNTTDVSPAGWNMARRGAWLGPLRQPNPRPSSVCLANFDIIRYLQHAWVVMPNHVHACFHCARTKIGKTAKSWKERSAHNINIVSPEAGHFGWRIILTGSSAMKIIFGIAPLHP